MLRFRKLAQGFSFTAIAVLAAAACSQDMDDDEVIVSSEAVEKSACVVKYSVPNAWAGGFQADITITNNTGSAFDGWKLTWTFPGDQRVQNAWNSRVTQDGAKVTAAGEGWNGAIAPGQSVSFGLVGSASGSNPAPTDFAVNGIACNQGDAPKPPSDPPSDPPNDPPSDPPSDPPVSQAGNPFDGASFYINPDYVAEVQSSIELAPEMADKLEKVKRFPTAIWLDRLAMVPAVDRHLDAALEQQKREGKKVVTVFVVYDLPNRDCHANASNGELHLSQDGLNRYKGDYIDKIAKAFKEHPDQPIVAIIEPDSLPNLATNISDPRCAAAEAGYREGVAYALKNLAGPNVSLYLDAAHSGWLGWQEGQTKTVNVFKEVLTAAGGADLIRGFATNVANYSLLNEPGEESFSYQGNPCHDELTYVAALKQTLAAAGITNKSFIIDTSRNGVGRIRSDWGYWCNIVGAGLGERPAASPAAGIDAYFWIKPPGEADGTADRTAVRYDSACGGPNSDQRAPEAGQWFHEYFVELVKNANPRL